MKDDLISRQEAIDALAKFVPYAICDESTESYTNGLTDAYNLILQLPSAQPEITRCKDCIYFAPEKSGEHWNVCRFYDAPKTADGYCNDAERKEE